MPDQSDAGALKFHGSTLRVRPATASPARLLLLIHGRTGDEKSMWVFARDLPPTYWIVAPRAPYAAAPGGYSWVAPHDQPHAPIGLDDLQASVGALLDLTEGLAASVGVASDHFDAIGFSEGAALTIALGLMHPRRMRRMGVLAGFAPAGVERLLTSPVLDGIPVFVAHGTRDRLVSIEASRSTVALLQRLGAQVTVCEAEIGHKVSAACLHGLQTFFA